MGGKAGEILSHGPFETSLEQNLPWKKTKKITDDSREAKGFIQRPEIHILRGGRRMAHLFS